MKASAKSREGEVRCLNCFTRFRPPSKSERAACPSCGIEWRISYPFPSTPKIRGPVWDKYPAHD
jgi:DNA-directed RNA polymerase subunit RPC12/RpoP